MRKKSEPAASPIAKDAINGEFIRVVRTAYGKGRFERLLLRDGAVIGHAIGATEGIDVARERVRLRVLESTLRADDAVLGVKEPT